MSLWFRCLAAGLSLFLIVGCNNGSEVANPQGTDENTSPAESGQTSLPDSDAGQADPPEAKGEDQPAPPAAEETPQQLRQQAQQALQAKNLDEAIQALEKLVELDPDQSEVRLTLASLNEGKAIELAQQELRDEANPYFIRGGEHLREYLSDNSIPPALHANVANIFYNEACGYAYAGDDQQALDALEKAFSFGFNNVQQAQADPDLAEVAKTEEFKELLEQVAKKKQQALEEKFASFESYPFDFKLPNLEGDEVSLDDFSGKVLIVDFWGTWCPPCRKEIPHLLELREKYKDEGFEVVGINYEQVGPEQVKSTIEQSKQEFGITYPLLIGDAETRSQVPDFQGFPTTLFIDREGQVRLQMVGYHSYEELEAIVAVLLEEEA